MKKSKIFIGFLMLVVVFMAGVTMEKKIVSIDRAPLPVIVNEDIIFNKVNEWRITDNLKPFVKTDRVCNSAKIRLYEIKRNFSHDGFSPSRFCNSKIEGCAIGENLAKGNMTEDELLKGWLNSPSHRENMEFNFTYSCLVAEDGFVVQHFGSFF